MSSTNSNYLWHFIIILHDIEKLICKNLYAKINAKTIKQ